MKNPWFDQQTENADRSTVREIYDHSNIRIYQQLITQSSEHFLLTLYNATVVCRRIVLKNARRQCIKVGLSDAYTLVIHFALNRNQIFASFLTLICEIRVAQGSISIAAVLLRYSDGCYKKQTDMPSKLHSRTAVQLVYVCATL